jgi:hypothetical protein
MVLGKISRNLPFSFIRSLQERLHCPLYSKHVLSFHTERNARILEYGFPSDYPPWFRREKSIDSRNIYELMDVVCSPWDGIVWIEDSYIVGESIGSLRQHFGACRLDPDFKKLKNKKGVYVLCEPTGFYHFMFEAFPTALRALELHPEAKILLPINIPAYVKDALNLAGLDDRIDYENEIVRVEKVILFSRIEHSGFVDPDDIQQIKSSLADCVSSSEKVSPTKIFISRADSPKRGVKNERELHALVKRIGFRVVCLENMSLKEQIIIFSNADVVMGFHGAGFSNIIFSSEKCHVIELFRSDHFNDCFARLAVAAGKPYTYRSLPLVNGYADFSGLDSMLETINSTTSYD